jgi:hypothetical protein
MTLSLCLSPGLLSPAQLTDDPHRFQLARALYPISAPSTQTHAAPCPHSKDLYPMKRFSSRLNPRSTEIRDHTSRFVAKPVLILTVVRPPRNTLDVEGGMRMECRQDAVILLMIGSPCPVFQLPAGPAVEYVSGDDFESSLKLRAIIKGDYRRRYQDIGSQVNRSGSTTCKPTTGMIYSLVLPISKLLGSLSRHETLCGDLK